MEAIKKSEVQSSPEEKKFPDFVIQAFNECIAESAEKGSEVVKLTVVMSRIRKLGGKTVTSKKIEDSGWLDVEPFFRKAGWTVAYEQPSFREDGPSYYTFS